MRTILRIVFYIVFPMNIIFGQDTLNNWDRRKTSISIDSAYIGAAIFKNNSYFNYMRIYKNDDIIEYGHVDLKTNLAGDIWLYERYSNRNFYCSGKVKKSNKTGRWEYHCAIKNGCYTVYKRKKGNVVLDKSILTVE